MMDPRAFAAVAAAFGAGVMFVAWHSKTLRLDVEGADLAWMALVGFGMTWHGEYGSSGRIGTGLVAGAVASMAAFYGAMAVLPVTPFMFGLGMGVSAAIVATAAHMYPRVVSFAGAAVGYGVGIAASRAFPVRPITPADDLFALMIATSLCLTLGIAGSMALRAVVMRMGRERIEDTTPIDVVPPMRLEPRDHKEPKLAKPAPKRARVNVGAKGGNKVAIGAGR